MGSHYAAGYGRVSDRVRTHFGRGIHPVTSGLGQSSVGFVSDHWKAVDVV